MHYSKSASNFLHCNKYCISLEQNKPPVMLQNICLIISSSSNNAAKTAEKSTSSPWLWSTKVIKLQILHRMQIWWKAEQGYWPCVQIAIWLRVMWLKALKLVFWGRGWVGSRTSFLACRDFLICSLTVRKLIFRCPDPDSKIQFKMPFLYNMGFLLYKIEIYECEVLWHYWWAKASINKQQVNVYIKFSVSCHDSYYLSTSWLISFCSVCLRKRLCVAVLTFWLLVFVPSVNTTIEAL